MANWGESAGAAFSSAFNNQQALLQALIAAGKMGIVEKPIQRVGAMDPRRMLPGFAYKPMVPPAAVPTVPGPGGMPITGSNIETMPDAAPTMMPGRGPGTMPDMGTYKTYGETPDLERMLTMAKIKSMGSEGEQWKLEYANKYAANQVGDMGSLADPSKYEREWSKGYRIASVLDKIRGSGIDLLGMAAKNSQAANTDEPDNGTIDVEATPANEVAGENTVEDEVAFLESLSEADRQTVLDDPELDAEIKAAYLAKHPAKPFKTKSRRLPNDLLD